MLTGANGFIGNIIYSYIKKLGYSITTITSTIKTGSSHVKLDLSISSDVSDFVKKYGPFDVLIHCAAIAHGQIPPDKSSISEFNTNMVLNLLNAFGTNQPHWIFRVQFRYMDKYYIRVVSLFQKLPVPLTIAGKLDDEFLLSKSCTRLDILRLSPVYDLNHMEDIKKRVFIPRTIIKLAIKPSPMYTLLRK